MSDGRQTTFKTVTRASPCEICEGAHKCSRGKDGLIMCGRPRGDVPGFVFLGEAKADPQFGMYRRADDPELKDNQERDRRHARRPSPEPRRPAAGASPEAPPNGNGQRHAPIPPPVDWDATLRDQEQALTPDRRAELAGALGLPDFALSGLRVGFIAEDYRDGERPREPCWTFPEVDADGRIIGISRRYRDGLKKAMAGGGRGLTVPRGWREREGPVFLPEGPSDTLALTALGLAAIGRPSNTGGNGLLAKILEGLPADRPVIVLGEYDPNDKGQWPGRDGAVKAAAELAEKLGRPVSWALPPDKAKDVRKWALDRRPDPTCLDEWQELGQTFQAALKCHTANNPGPAASFSWTPIDSAAFAAGDYRPAWLARRLLVRGQPAIVGGPKKALKTSVLAALAISLASGRPFLGEFEIPRPVRVAMLSGESGAFTLQETGFRVCRALGIDLADVGQNLCWQFSLPMLSNPGHMGALRAGLSRDGIEVLILDPLYLALLAGQGPGAARPEDLFAMGPLLLGITRTCLDVGTTPVLIHHAKKNLGGSAEPLDLDDLAYAGVAEFARQWILINRREQYEPGTGSHRLWLNVGGSIGHGGLWSLDIEEGVLDDEFGGRKWEAAVATATETRQAETEEREQAKSRKRDEQNKADDAQVLNLIDRLTAQQARPAKGKKGKKAAKAEAAPAAVGFTKIRNLSGLSGPRMERAVERLLDAGIIEQAEIMIPTGKGGQKPCKGLRRKDHRSDEGIIGQMVPDR